VATSHEKRLQLINELVRTCHENGWTYDTSGVSDRISRIATGKGFNKATVRNLVYSVITILKLEKDARVGRQTAAILAGQQ
jgi:hypothetical protein